MDWYQQFLTADEGKMLEQLKGYGMTVVEPDVKAFREATTKIYEKYDSIWTKALREKIQNYKAYVSQACSGPGPSTRRAGGSGG